MENSKIKIYVIGRNDDKYLPLDDIRTKFYVNQKHRDDNIDFLNPWYCELTGLYHLWRNTKEPIIGLEHYRTYLYEDNGTKIMSKATINKLLETNDVICGRFMYVGERASLRNNLNKWTHGDLHNVLKVLKEYDSTVGEHFDEYLKLHGGYHVSCNIFIAKREIIEEWCKFLFNFLIEYEKVSPLSNKNGRREGYISEFLFGAWLEARGYKIRYSLIKKYKKGLTSGLQMTSSFNGGK